MCPTDSVLFFASEPISEATTAKPLPASPALAASIDALSDTYKLNNIDYFLRSQTNFINSFLKTSY